MDPQYIYDQDGKAIFVALHVEDYRKLFPGTDLESADGCLQKDKCMKKGRSPSK